MDKGQLSQKDKEILKINLAKSLKKYKKLPSAINLSSDNTIDIKFEGITNDLELIKKMVLNKIDEDCPFSKESIIYETLFLAGKGMAANYYSFYWSVGGTYYNKLYVTKDEIIIYSLDNFYRLINSRRIAMSQIDFIGISNKDIDGLKLSQENLIMKVKPDTHNHSSIYYFVPEKKSNNEELIKFNDLLIDNEVRNFIPKKLSSKVIWTYVFMFFIFILGILLVIN